MTFIIRSTSQGDVELHGHGIKSMTFLRLSRGKAGMVEEEEREERMEESVHRKDGCATPSLSIMRLYC